jgi:hypothetical protein
MARLSKELVEVEAVNPLGRVLGPPRNIPAGSEFEVTIPKLKSPRIVLTTIVAKIRVDGHFYS